jgi:hypothetical protein
MAWLSREQARNRGKRRRNLLIRYSTREIS